ncbi:MAG: T9SS type A sorting domain-containing protein [Flavobacteriaceae bacterium]
MKTLLFFLAGILSMALMAQDGHPDLSYGNNGVIVSDIATGENKFITGIASGVNDRVIIAGTNYENGHDNFIVAYNEDGTLDNSFGDNGILWTDGTVESYGGISVLDDEKILLQSVSQDEYTIKRLLPNGDLDISFGTNGQIQPFSPEVFGGELLLDNDNNLLVLGKDAAINEPNIILRKFYADGSMDLSFGSNGTVVYTFGNVADFETSSFIIKDDRIFIGINYSENNLTSKNIFKLMSNGSIDTTFGINGMATIPIEEEYRTSFTIFQDGSFLVGGYWYDINTFEYIRKTIKLFPDATLNENFGNNGSLIGVSGGYIQENQRIILDSSFTDFEGGITIVYSRFFPGGTQDTSFQFSSNYTVMGSAEFLALNSGKFLIIGTDIWYNGPPINIILQRFNNSPLSAPDFKNQKTTIYPNPSNGIFIIESDFHSEKEVYQITDVTGKIIALGELNEKQSQIDLSAAQSGVYFLKTANSVFRLLKN